MRGETAAPVSRAEDIRTALLAAGLSGWEEREAGECVHFVFYCPVTSDVQKRTRAVERSLGDGTDWMQVDEEDWAHAWKRFWKPQRIGRRLVVKPTWETCEAKASDVVISLDPGMAFGSGTHETTRMCIEWLETMVHGGERILDIGCGSGILAIVALRLGAARVVALDNDPVAVAVTKGNLHLNGVASQARVIESEGLDALAPDERFDIVTANIVADAIIAMAHRVIRRLSRCGRLIGSGIIVERVNDVRTALEQAGYSEQAWRTEGEWASVCAGAASAK